jgi:hypothetical protein
MNGVAIIPAKNKPTEYFRLYFTIINIYKKKKTLIGGESKNIEILKGIGEHLARDEKTKFYITKITESRV